MEGVETAYDYDLWSGLYLLSAACGRHCYVDRPRVPVHLNLFVVLTADSGITRKTTCVKEARKVLLELDARFQASEHYSILDGKSSTEFILDRLFEQSVKYDQCQMSIMVDEMITVFGKEKYATGIPGLLTDLYDCPEDRRGGGTVSAGVKPLRRVFVSMLTASTQAWLLRAINPDVIEGGFTSRTMFVVQEQPKKSIPWPEGGLDRSHIVEKLHDYYEYARSMGKVSIADRALSFFSKWYRTRTKHRDPYRSSFESREDAHILKVSALLCINDKSFVIGIEHLKIAIYLVNEAKNGGTSLFESSSNYKVLMGLDKIRDVFISYGTDPISHSLLYAKVRAFLSNEQFCAAVDIMHQMALLQKFEHRTGERGKPTILYRGTRGILGRSMVETVAEKMRGTE